jgi:hypothetical protein
LTVIDPVVVRGARHQAQPKLREPFKAYVSLQSASSRAARFTVSPWTV